MSILQRFDLFIHGELAFREQHVAQHGEHGADCTVCKELAQRHELFSAVRQRLADLETQCENAAYLRCPKCGRTENCRDYGGNDNCFHCECGFIQCDDRDAAAYLRP